MIPSSVLLLFCPSVAQPADLLDGLPPLTFKKGRLKVAIFTDLHYGENEPTDQKSDRFQRTILDLEQPDFVVLNGDMSSNYAADGCGRGKNCTLWWRKQWERYTAPVKSRGVPYASIWGNHDALDSDPSPQEMIRIDRENRPWSHTRLPPPGVDRATNYFLPLFADEGAQKPAGLLWFLDSGAEECQGLKGWACVLPSQVAWMRRTAEALYERFGKLRSHMFIHIPLPEVMSLWDLLRLGGRQGGVRGSRGEDVSCSVVNTGLLATLKDLRGEAPNSLRDLPLRPSQNFRASSPSVQNPPSSGQHLVEGVWHGHDHNNDFVGQWVSGVFIGYGRKSGHGGYSGSIASNPGARILVLSLDESKEDFSWETYIRIESGDIIRPPSSSPSTRRGPQGICSGVPTTAEAGTVEGWIGAVFGLSGVVVLAAFLLKSFRRRSYIKL